MAAKRRLDVFLVERGLALSRTHAQQLIEAGQVFLSQNRNSSQGQDKVLLKKASLAVTEDMQNKIGVDQGPANRFVSRGGLKLEGALEHVGLKIEGLQALDVGISTGGFTDCLLQNGVSSVLGVDVGHDQVHPQLLQNPKLRVIEGINARSLSKDPAVQAETPQGKFDLVVMDVSFISITLIVPELTFFLKQGGHLLSLVKPQFEVGVDGLSKGGIVKDKSLFAEVEQKVRALCSENGFVVVDYFPSPIQGKDGNNEFFVFAKKN